MPTLLWGSWADTWKLYSKVTFDGENRLIIINPGENNIFIKSDVYSAWKEWVRVDNNLSFPSAIRVVGGDPIGGGLFTGDIYFLMNGWQILVNEQVQFEGAIYHDDGISPFIINAGGGVISTVSQLVQSINTTGGDCDPTEIANAVANNIQPTLDLIDVPVSSRASETVLNNNISLLTTLLSAVDSKISLIDDQIVHIDIDISQMLNLLEEVKKLNTNRSKIDPANKTLTIYDDDQITPLIIFDLLDTNSTPSVAEVAEKVPR